MKSCPDLATLPQLLCDVDGPQITGPLVHIVNFSMSSLSTGSSCASTAPTEAPCPPASLLIRYVTPTAGSRRLQSRVPPALQS